MQVPLFGIGVTGNLAGPLLLPTDPSSTGGAQVFVNGVPVGPVFTSLAGAPIVGTVTALIPCCRYSGNTGCRHWYKSYFRSPH
ncbi:hypothetical protein JFV29_13220 [Peribacillus sp. TH16]|uniref:hypothetical protein n=1 Tax=Peribacillus sp. TH16 TaxID=2798482 RepID=UPI001912A87A|nr:hypothetical protein [Peribacillus sp. TH16]MBK5482836.1 hypothetical protein [Peribacillus sp. TH16]